MAAAIYTPARVRVRLVVARVGRLPRLLGAPMRILLLGLPGTALAEATAKSRRFKLTRKLEIKLEVI